MSRSSTATLALVLLVLGVGCTEHESKLAKSDGSPSQASAPELLAAIPAVAAAPSGVPVELWSDIAWFPASTMAITGYPRGSTLHFVEWLRDSLEGELSECAKRLDGINRYYMVGDEAHVLGENNSQTLVFYGSLDRDEFEECAKKFALTLGGAQITRAGPLTILGAESPTYVAWARHGDETVVIYDDTRERLETFLSAAPRLEANPELVELLRRWSFDARVWSVSRADLGTVTVGVKSTGHAFATELPDAGTKVPLRFLGKLFFSTAAEAQAAAAGAEQLRRELVEAAVEVSGSAQAEANALRYEITTMLPSGLTEAQMQRVLELLEQRRKDAGLEQ
jgi:hypothetical protein